MIKSELSDKDNISSDEFYKILTEQSFLPLLVLQGGSIKYYNNALLNLLELNENEIKGINIFTLFKFIRKDYLYFLLSEYKKKKYGRLNFIQNQTLAINTNKNHTKWVELYSKSLKINNSVCEFITVVDITKRIKAESEIKYLAYHDKLTGLYNRDFLEEEINRIDLGRIFPVSIILGDLNGLKLSNDVFGQFSGDRLLISMSKILKSVCRKEDIIARWGGDEFLILLPSTDTENVERICNRIKSRCNKNYDTPIQPSISLGYATKANLSQSIQQTIKIAEDMMYRNKLLESKSTRNAIISSIRKTLLESSFETEEHTKRVLNMAKEFSKFLALSDREKEDLELLSLLHDIGKIAIPSYLLLKPDKLTCDEWSVIKTHPEKGYKIAISNQELAHIAEGILTHHERWDGKGYPQGLKGEIIPKLSRVISILDSYDVMTHSTTYKTSISHSEAIQEIIDCSNKQFDPELVAKFVIFMKEKKAC